MKRLIIITIILLTSIFLISDANAQKQDSLRFPIKIELHDTIFQKFYNYKILSDSVEGLKSKVLYQYYNQYYIYRPIDLRYDFKDTYYTRYTFTIYLYTPHFRKKIFFY